MKNFYKIIVLLFISIILCYCAFSYYLGARYYAALQENLTNTQIPVKLTESRRGVFRSTYRLDGMIAGKTIAFKTEVQHGPIVFPWAFMAYREHTSLVDNETTHTIFQLTAGKTPFESIVEKNFQSHKKWVVNIAPISLKNKGFNIHFSGLNAQGDTSNLENDKIAHINGIVSMDNFSADSLFGNALIKNIHASFDYQLSDNQKFYVGDITFTVDEAKISQGNRNFGVSNWQHQGQTTDTHQMIGDNEQGSIGHLWLDTDLGAIEYKISIKNMIADLMSISHQSQINEALIHRILTAKPSFSVDTLKWKNSVGEATAKGTITLRDQADLKRNGKLSADIIDSLAVTLNLPKAFVSKLEEQLSLLGQGNHIFSNLHWIERLDQWVEQGVLTRDDNVYKLDIIKQDNTFKFNGKNVLLDDLSVPEHNTEKTEAGNAQKETVPFDLDTNEALF